MKKIDFKKLTKEENKILLSDYGAEEFETTEQDNIDFKTTDMNMFEDMFYWTVLDLKNEFFSYYDDELSQLVYCHRLNKNNFEIINIETID